MGVMHSNTGGMRHRYACSDVTMRGWSLAKWVELRLMSRRDVIELSLFARLPVLRQVLVSNLS